MLVQHVAMLVTEGKAFMHAGGTWWSHRDLVFSALRLSEVQWLGVVVVSLFTVALLFGIFFSFNAFTAPMQKVEKDIEDISVKSLTSSGQSTPRQHAQGQDCEGVQQVRVKATGRIGTILQQDPLDDNLTYKLKFLDGADPAEDWFARSEVEVSNVAETSNTVPPISPWGKVGMDMDRGELKSHVEPMQPREVPHHHFHAARGQMWHVSAKRYDESFPHFSPKTDGPSIDDPNGPDAEGDGDMYMVNGEEIVADMGISGLCLVSKRETMSTVILIAGQAFFLQFMILFYIVAEGIKPSESAKALPTVIVDAAIYLHFINCVRDLPRSIFVLKHFHQVHTESLEFAVFGFIFIVDGFVTPLAQLFIGALFLCTSLTVADVIMNACAVAYISNIDNFILEVRKAMNDLGLQPEEYEDVNIPVNVNLVRNLNILLCVVPLFPFAFSCIMGYLGLNVLKL